MKSVRKSAGYLMIALAVIGMALPLMPGIPFLAAGLALLGRDHPLVRRLTERLEQWRKWRRSQRDSGDETLRDYVDHFKWTLIGFFYMLGLPVIVSVVFSGTAYEAAGRSGRVGESNLLVLGLTLGVFLVGGFINGWINETPRVLDSVVAAILALALHALAYAVLPGGDRVQFAGGNWLTDGLGNLALTWQSALFAVLATVAATAGASVGYLIDAPSRLCERMAVLIGMIAAIFGPLAFAVAAGSFSGGSGDVEVKLLILVMNIMLVGLPIGIIHLMFYRKSRADKTVETPRATIEPARGGVTASMNGIRRNVRFARRARR